MYSIDKQLVLQEGVSESIDRFIKSSSLGFISIGNLTNMNDIELLSLDMKRLFTLKDIHPTQNKKPLLSGQAYKFSCGVAMQKNILRNSFHIDAEENVIISLSHILCVQKHLKKSGRLKPDIVKAFETEEYGTDFEHFYNLQEFFPDQFGIPMMLDIEKDANVYQFAWASHHKMFPISHAPAEKIEGGDHEGHYQQGLPSSTTKGRIVLLNPQYITERPHENSIDHSGVRIKMSFEEFNDSWSPGQRIFNTKDPNGGKRYPEYDSPDEKVMIVLYNPKSWAGKAYNRLFLNKNNQYRMTGSGSR